jgi:hypothetical protein
MYTWSFGESGCKKKLSFLNQVREERSSKIMGWSKILPIISLCVVSEYKQSKFRCVFIYKDIYCMQPLGEY